MGTCNSLGRIKADVFGRRHTACSFEKAQLTALEAWGVQAARPPDKGGANALAADSICL